MGIIVLLAYNVGSNRKETKVIVVLVFGERFRPSQIVNRECGILSDFDCFKRFSGQSLV